MSTVDIRPDHADIVHKILEKFVPDNAVWVFGSRAKWLAKEYSDLDLCIISDTPLPFVTLGLLDEALEDSDLPYKVDIVDWATTSPEFRKIIVRDKIVFKTGQHKKMEKSFKQGWIETTLGEIVETIFSGGTPSTTESSYWGGTYNWLSSGETRNYFIFTTEKTITEFGIKKSSTRLANKGDIVIASAGQGHTRGQTSYLLIDTYINQSVISIRTNKEKINSLWLFYNLSNRYDEMRQMSDSHSSRGSLTTSILKTMPISYPCLGKQKKIASILKSLDDKIAINSQINHTLETMAQAIFKSWFVDFDPVYAKKNVLDNGGTSEQANLVAMSVISGKSGAELEELKTGNPQAYNELAHTASLFPSDFEDSELGRIPSGWGIKGIDDVAKFLNGLALQKFRPKDDNHYLPVLKIAQLKKGSTDGSEKACVNIPKEYIIDNGDIIFSWSGSLCVDIWCGGKAALNQHLFKVTSNNYPKWFYYHYTKHHLKDFQKIASDKAVTMGHIKREHLTQALCAIPSESLLSCANEIIEKYLIQIINIREQSQTLSQIRDSLLPKLLSGEIDVNNQGYIDEI